MKLVLFGIELIGDHWGLVFFFFFFAQAGIVKWGKDGYRVE